MIASAERRAVTVRRPTTWSIDCAASATGCAVSAETLRRAGGGERRRCSRRHLVVRDDGMLLFGFASEEERELFLS